MVRLKKEPKNIGKSKDEIGTIIGYDKDQYKIRLEVDFPIDPKKIIKFIIFFYIAKLLISGLVGGGDVTSSIDEKTVSTAAKKTQKSKFSIIRDACLSPFCVKKKQEEIECIYTFRMKFPGQKEHIEIPTTSTNYTKLEKITHLPFFYELGLNNYFASDTIRPSGTSYKMDKIKVWETNYFNHKIKTDNKKLNKEANTHYLNAEQLASKYNLVRTMALKNIKMLECYQNQKKEQDTKTKETKTD